MLYYKGSSLMHPGMQQIFAIKRTQTEMCTVSLLKLVSFLSAKTNKFPIWQNSLRLVFISLFSLVSSGRLE